MQRSRIRRFVRPVGVLPATPVYSQVLEPRLNDDALFQRPDDYVPCIFLWRGLGYVNVRWNNIFGDIIDFLKVLPACGYKFTLQVKPFERQF